MTQRIYLGLLVAGIILTVLGYYPILRYGHKELTLIAQCCVISGVSMFFFSSGIAATFASSKNLSRRFLSATKKVSVIVTLLTLGLAGLSFILDGTLQNLKAIGFFYVLFAFFAWAQILLGLAIGFLFRTESSS